MTVFFGIKASFVSMISFMRAMRKFYMLKLIPAFGVIKFLAMN